jgi:hypothetical protein
MQVNRYSVVKSSGNELNKIRQLRSRIAKELTDGGATNMFSPSEALEIIDLLMDLAQRVEIARNR